MQARVRVHKGFPAGTRGLIASFFLSYQKAMSSLKYFIVYAPFIVLAFWRSILKKEL